MCAFLNVTSVQKSASNRRNSGRTNLDSFAPSALGFFLQVTQASRTQPMLKSCQRFAPQIAVSPLRRLAVSLRRRHANTPLRSYADTYPPARNYGQYQHAPEQHCSSDPIKRIV